MAADVYEQFRLSLVKRRPDDLFTPFEATREAYLRQVFSEAIYFNHYGNLFNYIAVERDLTGAYILGKAGRIVRITENAPPEENFAEKTHDGWRAAVIVVDPRETTDGQKIAVQSERLIGKPFSIVRSICRELNENKNAPYTIEVEPLFNASNFWEFAQENKGDITSLTFEFVVPNGWWTTASSLRDELKAADEIMGAQTVVTTFKSDNGINTDNEVVAQSVAYTETGSGKISASTRNGKKFSSTTKPRKAILPLNPLDTARDAIARAALNLARILGHE